MSSRHALHLMKLGVKLEIKIPLIFRKSGWAMIAMLAVLKAGGAYVPLDPEDTSARREAITAEVGAPFVLAGPGEASAIFALPVDCVVVDAAFAERWPLSFSHETWPASPHHTAYDLFTSGSTGKPKGVVMEHAAVITSAKSYASAISLYQDSRVFQYTAYTFDVSVAETITALIYGTCVCVPSEEERPGDIAASMRKFKVNWADEVPPLRTLVLGGEAVSQDHAATWASWTNLIVGYWPSETCVFSSAGFIETD